MVEEEAARKTVEVHAQEAQKKVNDEIFKLRESLKDAHTESKEQMRNLYGSLIDLVIYYHRLASIQVLCGSWLCSTNKSITLILILT